MAANDHQTYIYVGLAGEGQYMAEAACTATRKILESGRV